MISRETNVIARSGAEATRRGNPVHGRDCFASLAMTGIRLFARELLPIFLILYPFLLLLDDVEPGIVRSVFNPHWLLLAIVGLGTLSTQDEAVHRQLPLPAVVTIAILGAAVGGLWAWWRIHAGPLGIVIGMLTAIAVFTTTWTAFSREHPSYDGKDI